MSYTEIYKKIYDQIKFDKISHKEAHRMSILITDVISNLCGLIIKENSVQLQRHSSLTNTVNEIINQVIEDDLGIDL